MFGGSSVSWSIYFWGFRWFPPIMVNRIWECSKRTQILLFTTVVFLMLYFLLNVQNYSKYTGNRPFTDMSTCRELSNQNRSHLLNLTYQVHQILEENRIQHWLSYGSIFGALRNNGPLPWDDDVDFGILGDGKLSQLEHKEFIALFEDAGLQVTDWWTRSGLIQISAGHPYLKVDLMAFYKWGHWMKRCGYESWIGFYNYNKYHTFPSVLITPPLPKAQFGNRKLPLPRNGIEIQKFMYPADWWKVIPPPQCSTFADKLP